MYICILTDYPNSAPFKINAIGSLFILKYMETSEKTKQNNKIMLTVSRVFLGRKLSNSWGWLKNNIFIGGTFNFQYV